MKKQLDWDLASVAGRLGWLLGFLLCCAPFVSRVWLIGRFDASMLLGLAWLACGVGMLWAAIGFIRALITLTSLPLR